MYVAVRMFYKNVRVGNLQNLPTDKPVILTSNHPNAFMDAIVLSVFVKQKLNYLTRSDVFKGVLKKWILESIGLIPIYRIQEGADQLHKNEETFVRCYKLLQKKGTVLIFSEGICIQERRLRKLKKGTARIAFGALESAKNDLDLMIVPVGINYSKPKNFRSTLFINFGKPFKASDFHESYKKDKTKGIGDFTSYLEQRMAEQLVIIKNKTNDRLVEDIEEIYKHQLMLGMGLNPKNLHDDFKITCDIANAVNYFYKHDHERVEHIKHNIYHYLKELEELKLRDYLLHKETVETISTANLLKDYFFLIIGMPIHLLGLITNYLPYKISYLLTNKIVREEEFHSSVNISIGAFLYLIYYTSQIIAVNLIFHNWKITLVYLLFLPLIAIYNLKFYPIMKKVIGKGRLYSLLHKQKHKAERLIHKREEIISELEKAKKEYCAILVLKK